MLGGHLGEEVEEALGLYDIVLKKSLYTVRVFLAAHVFVGREISYDVETAVLTEEAFEDGISEIEGIGAEIGGYVHALGRTEVAGELGKTVLTEVDDNELGGLEGHGFDVGGADRACAANNEDFLALNFLGELRGVGLDVGQKHALLSAGDVVANELLYV